MLFSQIVAKGFEYCCSLASSNHFSIQKTKDLPHIGFFGSSNAGKSSLISSLCNQKNLAFSSKRPGKTTEIVTFTPKHPFFHKKSFFVDFPGYGFAKVSNQQLETFEFIPEFIEMVNLEKAYILIPIQKPFSKNDISMIDLLGHKQFAIVLTKCEKYKMEEIEKRKLKILQELEHYGNFTRQIFITSAKKKIENDDIMKEIFDIFKRYINQV